MRFLQELNAPDIFRLPRIARIPEKSEPTIGIEPMTSSLPRKCSTTELRGHFNVNDSPITRIQKGCTLEREKGLEPSTLSLEG